MSNFIRIALIIAFVLVACSKSKTDDDSPASNTQIAENYRIHGSLYDIPRCDNATFQLHAASVGKQDVTPADFEAYPNGHLRRDKSPCYPNESDTSGSVEMYIGWLHWIWTNKNADQALDRLIAYGENHGWDVGDGDSVNISQLVPMIYLMKSKLKGASLTESNLGDTLSGFRGHILASYLWLWLRVEGKIGPAGKEAIHQLYEASSGDPMYIALWQRVNNGDFSDVYSIMDDRSIFPEQPNHETAAFGWGSCPDWLYFLMVDGIIRGT